MFAVVKVGIRISIVVALCAGSYFPQSPVDNEFAVTWQRYELPNKMQVLMMPDTDASEVSLEFWLHSGTRDEPAGLYGFAHFFEHATPYGLRDDEEARSTFRSGLTNSNAQTRKDYTRYYLQMKPENLGLALRYISERMSAPTGSITDTLIETHRTNVLNEIGRQDAHPFYGATASGARYAATFGMDHPYGHSGYGSIDANRQFTSEMVRKWYLEHVQPANITLFVAGRFDPEELKPQILNFLGGFKNSHPRDEFKPLGTASVKAEAIVLAGTEKHTVSITWNIPEWGSEDEPAFRVLAAVLDGRLSATGSSPSRSSGSSELLAFYEYAGMFGVYGSFDLLENRNQVEKFLRDSVSKLANLEVTRKEFETARGRVFDEFRESRKQLGFAGSRTELLGEGLLFRNDPDHFLKQLDRLRLLKRSDLKRVVTRRLARGGSVTYVFSRQNCDDPALCKPPDR